MKRFAAPLSVFALAAAALAGCAYERVPPSQPTIAPQAMSYQPGAGVVQRVIPAPAAAAGGTTSRPVADASGAPSSDTAPTGRMNRLVIRMDNGVTQYIDTDNLEIKVGDRVELTPDHFIRVAL